MTPERHQQIGRLFHRARALPHAERRPFLEETTAGDAELRAEVESLLAADDNAGPFLAEPAVQVAAKLLPADSPPLTHIGRYRLVSLLGRGGMGDVYLADDPVLPRKVAIKLLRPALTAHGRALARFEQEARAASSLNHPNIVTIYEIGTAPEGRFIAMEFVEGRPLSDWIGERMPAATLVPIARQLAQALTVAHAAGIVHRDVKPDNVMLRPDGYVKLLDFGIARLASGDSDGDRTDSSLVTQAGLLIGTPRYMSPEQIRGESATPASDLFALGAVLYELATGRHPSESESTASSLSHDIPPGLTDLVRGMLDRNPAARPSTAEVEARVRALTGGHTTVEHPRAIQRAASVKWLWVAAAAGIALALAAAALLLDSRRAPSNPLANARFVQLTDFSGAEQAAAISRDGKLVAFLSDRDGRMDVWVTQVGSGEFHNLTRGSVRDLVNPSIRTLDFSPDGTLVTFWTRRGDSQQPQISIWAVPVLGGSPRLYLDGVAEYHWSDDAARIVYHTPGPGDPTFIRDASEPSQPKQIFSAPSGLHAHFPQWSPDRSFIYFVQGSVPDRMDVWRVKSTGGMPERITNHSAAVMYAAFLDERTLVYLATDPDGSGPWIYAIDVDRRVPRRASFGIERYTSLSASSDGRRLVTTLATAKSTLWHVAIGSEPAANTDARPIPLTTGNGSSPRLGDGFLLYTSSTGSGDSIWKLRGDTATQLWSMPRTRVIGGPAMARDGRVAFSARRDGGPPTLWVINSDGTNARALVTSLELQGAPAWAPAGDRLVVGAVVEGVPNLFMVPVDGGAPVRLVREHSSDPAWSPDGGAVVFSGADIGTTFKLKAVDPKGQPHSIPDVTLTRGARHVAFLNGTRSLIVLRGDLGHKNLWAVDLETGAARQLTNFAPGFDLRDFDVAPDGREIVVEQVQEHSDIVLLARQ